MFCEETETGGARRRIKPPVEEEKMAIWQWALLALALLWGIQSLGVWFQMRHYSDVLKGVTSRYSDGFVGAGHVRGRFGKGVIVMIVVDRDLKIRRFLEMSGRTVFAKFKRQEAYEGMSLNALRREQEALEKSPVNAAAKQAMDQIDRIREQSDGASLEGLKLAHA
ncbi:glucitol operon activator protein [Ochrobactrum sp. RH2CCR150]|nr:glucitol operon activator protein [Ochrobactrum sp. RH2CCR150]